MFPAHYVFELSPSELRYLKSKRVLISNVSNKSSCEDTERKFQCILYILWAELSPTKKKVMRKILSIH